MTWKEFCEIAVDANNRWTKIKNDFPENKEVLEKSYLVICHHERIQLSLNREYPYFDIASITNNRAILMDTEIKNNLLILLGKMKDIQKELKSLKPMENKYKQVNTALFNLRAELKLFNLNQLEISDDIQVEVRFPWVNMNIIQKIKSHALVDSRKTCMCMACIRVVL